MNRGKEVFSKPPYFVANLGAIIKRARIVEDLCIGCTRCITVCPTDSITGAPKFMHEIIEQQCSGCELCLEVCPTDCIEMVEDEGQAVESELLKLSFYRERYLRKMRFRERGDAVDRSKILRRVRGAVERAATLGD